VDVVADGWALLSQEMIAESINCINCYLKKTLFVSQRLPFEWVQFDTYAAFPGSSG